MKRFLTLFLLIGTAWGLHAGNVVTDFAAKAASSRVAFRYTYSVNNAVKLQGSGSALVQGDAFYVQGDGLDVYCDGKTRWTVDKTAKEVIVESVDQDFRDYAANPALLVASVGDAFSVQSVAESKFKGKACTAGVLSPKEKMDMSLLKLYFVKNQLAGAAVTMKDGTVTEFVVSDLVFSEVRPAGKEFTFDLGALDNSWVVTDLTD